MSSENFSHLPRPDAPLNAQIRRAELQDSVDMSKLPQAEFVDQEVVENSGYTPDAVWTETQNARQSKATADSLEEPVEESGFGASLGINEQDLVRSAAEDKSNTQVAFERLENVAKRAAENSWNKGVEIFGRCTDWAKRNWEQIKTVSKEWAGDVVETIKLNTVDKWRTLNERDEYNRLMRLKAQDIRNLGGRIETENQNIAGFESGQTADEEKFQAALLNMTNPGFREVFERNKTDRFNEWEAKKQGSRDLVNSFDETRRQYAQEIYDFHEGMKNSGNRFAEKLDNKINKIHEKYGYDEKKSCLFETENLIAENQDAIENINTNLLDHIHHLKLAKELGINENDQIDIENGIRTLVAEKDAAEARIAQFQKVQEDLQKNIAKIDKKTERYRKIKTKMGLDKEGNNPSEIAGDDANTNNDEGTETTNEDNDESVDDANVEALGVDLGDVENDSENEPNVESNAEAIEKTTEAAKELLKTITKKNVKAVEIIRSLMGMQNVFDINKDKFKGGSVDKLLKNLRGIIKIHNKEGILRATEADTFQLKRTVINEVIRQLPEEIEL